MEPIDPRHLPPMPELMIAGPGHMHEEDLGVLGEQLIAHYGDVWVQLHNQTVNAVGRLVNAKDPPYVMPGTGTACLDAAAMNLFEPGQTVVVARTGFFGERLHEGTLIDSSAVRSAHDKIWVHAPGEAGESIAAELDQVEQLVERYDENGILSWLRRVAESTTQPTAVH